MSSSAITREITDAGVGVGRLVWYDPRWPEGFDPTTGGFLRSFIGPLLALPFNLVVSYTFAHAQDLPAGSWMWAAGVSHVLNTIAFPALIAAAAKPLGIGEGYAGFIIVVNWASLFVSIATAAASLLSVFGQPGLDGFVFVWLILFGLSLFITWRAAREILSQDIPIALLMVVLSVGVGALIDQVCGFAFGLSPLG